MLSRIVLSFALVSLCAAPLVRAQVPADEMEAGQTQSIPQQSIPQTGCTPAMLASGMGCSSGQSQAFPSLSYQPGVAGPMNLGYVPPDMATAGNQWRPWYVQPSKHFPPDKPTEFQKFVVETTGQFLPIYGQNLFREAPSTFAPSDQSPVPANYVIGPDDQLRIRIWGQINFSGNVRVDRSGNIYLPQIGAVEVAGLPFSEIDPHLRSVIAKYFRNFDLSVELGQIRSIQVYISGEARQPGAYTVSALSSLVDALFATGGPSPEGSLRHILLKREGKTVADFDLYALLIHGDKSGDARLLPEDVIYIPPAGPEVAITGSVRSPGIYELRSGDTVGSLISMAGGATAVAAESQISLQRVDQHQSRSVLQVDFNAAGLATVLDDGDILRINSIVPAFDKSVTLRGNVANPGQYSWHPGMTLSDLIPNVDSLTSRDYWWERSHLGLPAPEFEPAISKWEKERQTAAAGLHGNEGAQMPEASESSGATVVPLTNQLQSQSSEAAAKAAKGPETNATIASAMARGHNIEAAPRDTVRIPKDEIDWNYAVIERVNPNSLKPSLIPFDLGKLVLDHDQSANLPLKPGDTVTIFSQSDIRVPVDQQVKYVELEGEFVHPGFYSVSPGETLRDVVRRAGGLTPQAYLYGSEFTRESTRILQQQRLDDYLRSLSLDAERGTQALAATSTSASGAMGDVAASKSIMDEMISRLSQVKATGRIVLQFHPNSASVDDIPPIGLENGDKFVVPFAPSNINVVGAVYDQNSYLYRRGETLDYYLRLAGGANRNADWHHAFLIRADGSVVSRTHVPGRGFWKESFNDIKLNPGDTIVVPDKTLRPTALRGLLDWSQLFSQLALGAAVINVL